MFGKAVLRGMISPGDLVGDVLGARGAYDRAMVQPLSETPAWGLVAAPAALAPC